MNSTSGGSRFRAPIENDVGRMHGAGVEQHAQRHAPLVPARRALGRVQVAVSVEPDDREPVEARRQPLNGADVGAAAAAQDERPVGKRSRESEVLLVRDSSSTTAASGYGSSEKRGLDHRLAVCAPGARNPDEARGEGASAGVALVLAAVEGDSRQRPAVGAARPESRHRPQATGRPDRPGRSRPRCREGARGRSAPRAAADRSSPPRRLIQTAGMPSSRAGAMSWKRLAATCTCRSGSASKRSKNVRQCPWAGL